MTSSARAAAAARTTAAAAKIAAAAAAAAATAATTAAAEAEDVGQKCVEKTVCELQDAFCSGQREQNKKLSWIARQPNIAANEGIHFLLTSVPR